MNHTSRIVPFLCCCFLAGACMAQSNNGNNPTWWNKYQTLLANGSNPNAGPSKSLNVGANVDVSNECGPQSETYIAINSQDPKSLAAGSNEIFRLPMRGYSSSDSGSSWTGVDLPLPPAIGANGIDFGSDPSLVFDSQGNAFYSYIVVFFSAGKGNGSINGTEMAVARSADGGKSYPNVTYFSFSSGADHFNDKPMITADVNSGSLYRNNIYVAWDAASGGSSGGGVRLATSRDHGATFTTVRVDDPNGPGRAIGAVPFVGPNGEVYAAWNDYAANAITFNRSLDGGATWGKPAVVASKRLPFDVAIPAEFSRGALEYPACAADNSAGHFRGRLYCAWMDMTVAGNSDIFLAHSDDRGATWSQPVTVTDRFANLVDRFNHWLAADPITGDVNVSFYDTRNDTTGFRYMTDVYLSQSTDGGAIFAPNQRVTTVSSNEHDCNGTFPCSAGIDYGNQQGDYEGLASFGGVSHSVWTDSRKQLTPVAGCKFNAMEEVFTATVK